MGGLDFTAKVFDSGQNSGRGYDKLSLTLSDSGASFLPGGLKSFTDVLLEGGNVVVHLE
jgi:hypothetical protein